MTSLETVDAAATSAMGLALAVVAWALLRARGRDAVPSAAGILTTGTFALAWKGPALLGAAPEPAREAGSEVLFFVFLALSVLLLLGSLVRAPAVGPRAAQR